MNKMKLYGLVACGGQSWRMGHEKGAIVYHGKEQRYHAWHMLSEICEEVFLCCMPEQVRGIDAQYNVIPDDEEFNGTGPLAALLTAFKKFPQRDFLVTGCDYPFLTKDDLLDFSKSIPPSPVAAAFYNTDGDVYEPLLGYYSSSAGNKLLKKFSEGRFSLQQFLQEENAYKYFPRDPTHIISIDTPQQAEDARKLLTAHK